MTNNIATVILKFGFVSQSTVPFNKACASTMHHFEVPAMIAYNTFTWSFWKCIVTARMFFFVLRSLTLMAKDFLLSLLVSLAIPLPGVVMYCEVNEGFSFGLDALSRLGKDRLEGLFRLCLGSCIIVLTRL